MALSLRLELEIGPAFASQDAVRLNVLNVLDRFSRKVRRDFQSTTIYFDHDVKFDINKRFGATVASVEVGTDDPIYEDVNNGTNIRFNVMTKDFVPKTLVGTLNTQPGQGGFSHTDYENPRPGIEARGWTDIIAAMNEGPFFDALDDAIFEAIGL